MSELDMWWRMRGRGDDWVREVWRRMIGRGNEWVREMWRRMIGRGNEWAREMWRRMRGRGNEWVRDVEENDRKRELIRETTMFKNSRLQEEVTNHLVIRSKWKRSMQEIYQSHVNDGWRDRVHSGNYNIQHREVNGHKQGKIVIYELLNTLSTIYNERHLFMNKCHRLAVHVVSKSSSERHWTKVKHIVLCSG